MAIINLLDVKLGHAVSKRIYSTYFRSRRRSKVQKKAFLSSFLLFLVFVTPITPGILVVHSIFCDVVVELIEFYNYISQKNGVYKKYCRRFRSYSTTWNRICRGALDANTV